MDPSLLILVTNDDGVQSPGLLALKRALERVGRVEVIAPDRNRTGAARSITMTIPLWVEEVELADGSIAYATDGTPVDCVRTGALGFLDRPPNLIVSGINLSGNLGDDITYSGTVAAALEGIMLDIPAVSFSAEAYHPGYDLSAAADFAAVFVQMVLERGLPEKTLLNVNYPDPGRPGGVRGARITRLGKRVYGDQVQLQRGEGRRRSYIIYGDGLGYRPEAGTDFDAVNDGYVSVTPLHFDLTAHHLLEPLRSWDLGGLCGLPLSQPLPTWSPPLEPPPKAAIFDLDGTLVDSVELIVESFRYATRAVLGVELPYEEMIAHVGKPLREQMDIIDPARGEELVRVYREFNHREHDRMLKLYAGVADLLAELQAKGVRVGLVTSKSRATTWMAFNTTGIEPMLDAIVCAEDTDRNKPFPDPILRVLQELGVRAESACYVGDSPFDLQAAHAANVRSVAVTWGVFEEARLAAERPDRLVRSVEELAAVLGLVAGQTVRL